MKHITKLFTASFVVLMGQSVLGATQDDIIEKAIKKGTKKEGVVVTLHLEKTKQDRSSGKISDDGLRRLAAHPQLKQLKRLYLTGTEITDVGLGHLTLLLELDTLTLSDCDQITDRGLMALHGCKNLTLLRLQGTKVTPDGVARLRKELLPNIIKTPGFKR